MSFWTKARDNRWINAPTSLLMVIAEVAFVWWTFAQNWHWLLKVMSVALLGWSLVDLYKKVKTPNKKPW